jgi:GNAT superfamily N-acetyltransferase
VSGRVLAREEGLALRALRLAASPGALVTRAGTDVVVRTPSRPDHHGGNVVDLIGPPRPDEVPAVLTRVRRLLEPTGVARPHVRWERPVGVAAPSDEGAALAALEAGGFAPRTTVLLELPVAADAPAGAPPASGRTVSRLPVPGRDPDGDDPATARRWHGSDVLQRYAAGADVEAWRRWDAEGAAWDRGVTRALARLGRADVWLATAQGIPVATLTVLRDAAGVALLTDLVTHPAHRGRGHAGALLAPATAAEHAAAPRTRVLAEVEPGGTSERLLTRGGAVPVAVVVSALRAP